MRTRNLCIVACCVGLSWPAFVTAQPATSGSDDQSKTVQGQSQPLTPQDKEAQLIQAQQQKKAEEKAAAEQVRIAKAKVKAAAKQARIDQAQAEKAAAEQDRAAKAAEKAAARKKAQEDARRVEKLKKEMQKQAVQNKPAPAKAVAKTNAAPAMTNAVSGKEQRLNDLLRQYNADEITPYEYHLERAKIIAEP
jgi:hypothetical protein